MYNYERQVKYYETDKMGVVHHSNYIRWFEEARVEFMRDNDISYRHMEEEGIQIRLYLFHANTNLLPNLMMMLLLKHGLKNLMA